MRPVDSVLDDYFSKVAPVVRESISQYIAVRAIDIIPVDLVITHPHEWQYDAKNRLFRAVVGAFRGGLFPSFRHVRVVSEVEASAHYHIWVSTCYSVGRPVRKDAAVLVVDTGGNTTTCASLFVDQVEPVPKLTAVSSPSGEHKPGQGATQIIDRDLLQSFLQTHLGAEDYLVFTSSPGQYRRKAVGELNKMKRAFQDGRDDFDEIGEIALPPALSHLSEGDNRRFRDGRLIVSMGTWCACSRGI